MNTMLENLFVSRMLHSSLLSPVSSKYRLTTAELLVLLFLANNREYDTARDIANKLKITKSQVSVSVRNLEERGYLKGGYAGRNRRTIHLRLCDTASDIICEARSAQAKFISVLEQGFTKEELDSFKNYLQRATDNVNSYLKGSAAVNAGA